MTSAGKVLVLGTALVMSCLGCSSEDARYSEGDRYQLSTGAKGKTYKLDKKTGQTWLLTSVGEKSITRGIDRQQVVALPSSALKDLRGKLKFEGEYRICMLQLHNGTGDWDVVDVVIRMEGPDWSRQYRAIPNTAQDTILPPLTTQDFYVEMPDDEDTSGMKSWTIVGANGIRSTPH